MPVPPQDGTIGADLVVKPAPDSVRGLARPSGGPAPLHWSHPTTNTSSGPGEEILPLDYALLDEDDEVGLLLLAVVV